MPHSNCGGLRIFGAQPGSVLCKLPGSSLRALQNQRSFIQRGSAAPHGLLESIRSQLREVNADESTRCTPLTAFATAIDFCTCAFVSTTPDSVTLPFVVVTLMSVEGIPFVAISSALTFVVIHPSVPGWTDLSSADVLGLDDAAAVVVLRLALLSAAWATVPSRSAAPSSGASKFFMQCSFCD
jgi:hypothetical protein